MSYANNITHKCQLSAQAMFRAAVDAGTLTIIPSASIFAGIDDADSALPKLVCECKNASSEEPFDGNWSADLTVRVTASAEDNTDDEFHAMCGEVFAHLMLARDTVVTNLSNATVEFTCFFFYPRSQSWDIMADSGNPAGLWVGEFTATVKCCGSVVS